MKPLRALIASIAAVAAGTGLVFALRPVAPDLSLGVLYVLPVMAVAVAYGVAYAAGTAVACMLVFNFFFLPPVHNFTLRESENWVALGVYLGTAIVCGQLAAHARRRAGEAEQREREATLVASVSLSLLRSEHVQDELRGIATRTAVALDAKGTRIELGSLRRPEPEETAFDLVAGDRSVGRIFFSKGDEPGAETRDRVLPALASILAVAEDRERLGLKAVEVESLRRSDAIKTALLRSVSHDFRSPLTAVRAAVDGLRLQAGAAEPRPELWTADGIVGRALEELGEGTDRVAVSLGAESPAFRVDGAQAERALVNLIENALKFSSPTDTVDVSVETSEGEARIRVTDRGPGLTEAQLRRIFDPFERGTSKSGTGLGLTIARGFAEANGGRVWAESKAESGASFVLAFPLAETIVAAAR